MTPRQALDDLIREREETYAAVSRLLDRNSAYIQQYIKRGTPARLDQSDIAQLALHFDVPAKLLGGKESPSSPRCPGIVRDVRQADRSGPDQKSHFCSDRPSRLSKLERCSAKGDQCRRQSDLDWFSGVVSGSYAACDTRQVRK